MNVLKKMQIVFKSSIKRELQYKFNMVMCFLLFFIGYGIEVLYFFSMYTKVDNINGWTFPQALLLLGITFLVDSLFFGLIFFNLLRIPFLVRNYELDGALIKPVDSLLYLATKSINFGYLCGVIPGVSLIAISVRMLNIEISFGLIMNFSIFIVNSVLILSSIFSIFISTTLFLVKVDGMISMFWSIVEFGKKPSDIYPQGLKIFLTFVLPALLIYVLPSMSLISKSFNYYYLIFSIILLTIARAFWKFCLRGYYA